MTPRSRWVVLVAMLATTLVLASCGVQAYDLPLPGKVVSDSDGYRVSAIFANVDDIVPRSTVMVDDVPVGEVDSISRDGWDAKVTMTIKKTVVLPADATVSVQQTSLLGENYIALQTPAGAKVAQQGRLADGAVIPLSRTGSNPQVEDVLGALSVLLSGGGVDQLKTISTELNAMMNGRQGQIRDLLRQVDTLVTSLNSQRDTIIDAMQQVNTLTKTLNKEQSVIVNALDTFGPALKTLHQQRQALITMLTSLDRLGTIATKVINQSGAALTDSLDDLAPVLQKLGAAGDSLPRGLMMAASFPFPKQASTLAKGDYSNALFHMDFDLGQIVTGLSTGGKTGLPEALQLCSTYAKGCTQLQPVIDALCQLTHEDFACSMVGKADRTLTTTKPGTPSTRSGPDDTPTPTTPTTPPPDVVQHFTQQLLGGQPSGTTPDPGLGLGGLLGGLLGGGS